MRLKIQIFDIEGFEWQGLQGTKEALKSNMIDYIQLEYNGTWVDGGGSIKKKVL